MDEERFKALGANGIGDFQRFVLEELLNGPKTHYRLVLSWTGSRRQRYGSTNLESIKSLVMRGLIQEAGESERSNAVYDYRRWEGCVRWLCL